MTILIYDKSYNNYIMLCELQKWNQNEENDPRSDVPN